MRMASRRPGMLRVFLFAFTGVIAALAGVLVLPAVTAAAASCPTVNPGTGAVSPAPAPGVDWSGCNLTGANLAKADLAGANLTGANLYLASITSANFTGATLTGLQSGDVTYQSAPKLPANWTWITGGYLAGPEADLAGADLSYAGTAGTMDGVDLTGADLAGANLNDAYIQDADFAGANLKNATVTAVTLRDDTFTSATFAGADLSGVLVVDTTLAGADLSSSTASYGVTATFSGDDLSNANLASASLFGAKLSSDNLTDATFTNADLDTAKLTGDNVAGATLAGASLSQVTSSGLTGTPASLPANWTLSSGFLLGPTAYLLGADLSNADLSHADLSNANLDGAALTGATVTGANMSAAMIDDVSSGSLVGQPASLPANWSATAGYLFGPTANLANADLTGVNFGHADLEQAYLNDAKLANADLNVADMQDAVLDGVTSGGVNPGAARLPVGYSDEDGYIIGPAVNLDGVNLAGLNLPGMYLSNAQLANTDLENVNLSAGSLFGADLSDANLTNANLADVSLASAEIAGANFSGASLTGVESGSITGTPLNLPAPWQLLSGYLIGPGANLTMADLHGVTFDNADLLDANLDNADLSGTTWSNTICPDGSNSDNDGGTCAGFLDPAPSPVSHPSIAGRLGENGWYTSAVTVAWNWTVATGQINTAKCTAATTSSGEGRWSPSARPAPASRGWSRRPSSTCGSTPPRPWSRSSGLPTGRCTRSVACPRLTAAPPIASQASPPWPGSR